MKTLSAFRFLGIIALIIGFVVGCASVDTQTTKKQTSASAIAEAKSAIAKMNAVKWIWRDTAKILKKAEAAAKKGDEGKAVKLANQARDQAINALKQYHYENRVNRGIKPISGMLDIYTVSKGDSLWAISAKSDVYADPYQWPLIYKANSDSIKDADLIFPGQALAINTSPSPADVQAAISHARNRGAWSIGMGEGSDREFLALLQ
jgi:LysM repeat protein